MSAARDFAAPLAWIERQDADLRGRLARWAETNSGSTNLDGLAAMRRLIVEAAAPLDAESAVLDPDPVTALDDAGNRREVEIGPVLSLRKRPTAKRQVLLVGHMDTVFPKSAAFQKITPLDDEVWNGPGVADMKGGLIVMLTALEAFERSAAAKGLGWHVLINADEETGTYGSDRILREAAAAAEFGLDYEPALADGTLAGARKGAGNFTFVATGRAAHAGREHHLGRNAVVHLAKALAAADALNGQRDGITVNVAKAVGGTALNVVPDTATGRVQVRAETPADAVWAAAELKAIAARLAEDDGRTLTLDGRFHRPAKPMTPQLEALFDFVAECGAQLDMRLAHQPTGGCCDGNNLAAAGLPNVDTLGVRGGAIHSDQEFIHLDSLVERAKLSALILMRAAAGDAPAFDRLPMTAD